MKINLQPTIAFLIFLVISLSIGLSNAAEKKTRERLAVLDLEAKYGIEKVFAEGLSVIVRDTIHSYGEYTVMSQEDIRAVASREQLMQAMGCDDGSGQCLLDFGRAIGSRFMVAGSISKFGQTYTVSLRMLDTQGAKAGLVNRVSEDCKCDEEELIETIRNVAAKLIGKLNSPSEKKAKETKVVQRNMLAEELQKVEQENQKLAAEIEKLKQAKVKKPSESTNKIVKDKSKTKAKSRLAGNSNTQPNSQKSEQVSKVASSSTSLTYTTTGISDVKENLEWVIGKDIDTSRYNAKKWIEELHESQGQWRMPTLSELKTLWLNGVRADNLKTMLKLTGYVVWSKDNEYWMSGSHRNELVHCFDFQKGKTLDKRVEDWWNGRDGIEGVRVFAVRQMKNE